MPAYVASVRPFEVTIGSGATSNTATIPAVDATRSVIFLAGQDFSANTLDTSQLCGRAELTNATTVTVYRNTSGTNTVTVRGTVVEFTSATVASVQQGTLTIAASSASGTATISSVTTSRSAAFLLGYTTDNATNNANPVFPRLALTNGTTVTATRGTSSTNFVTVGYCVVQFQASAIVSMQPRSQTLSTATTSDTVTLTTAVNTANALVIWGGTSTSGSAFPSFSYAFQLTDGSTVTLTRTGTATSARVVNFTVIEFASGVITSIQRGTTAIAAATSADSTITAVDTKRSVLNSNAYNTTEVSTAFSSLFPTAKLLNATTVRGQKAVAGSSTSTVGWEVVEFAGYVAVTGSSSGTCTATGQGGSIVTRTGIASGYSGVTGTLRLLAEMVGTASGSSSVSGEIWAVVEIVGTASGSSTAVAYVLPVTRVERIGTASGSSTAVGRAFLYSTPSGRVFRSEGLPVYARNIFYKDPQAVLDYRVDWADWLGNDRIISSQWIMPPGIVKGSENRTDATTTIWLEGGTLGRDYGIVNRIATEQGRTNDQALVIKIRNQ